MWTAMEEIMLTGLAHEAANRLDEAAAAYRHALTLRPDSAEAWNRLGRVLTKRGGGDEALFALERAMALEPDRAETHFNLGNLLFVRERFGEAESHYRRALALSPDNIAPCLNLANLLSRQNRLDEAAQCYTRVIARLPQFAQAHHDLGIIYLRLGKRDLAMACLERAIAIDPALRGGRYTLGNLYGRSGRRAEAVDCYRRAALRLRLPEGLTIAVPPSLSVSTTYVLLEQERWFEKEIDFVSRFLRPGMTAIDIGANFGIYSLTMARRTGPDGRVFAYEPGTEARAHLQHSRDLNGLAGLEIGEAALSDRVGEGCLSFASAEYRALTAEGDGDGVQVTTLDHERTVHRWTAIDFIKIDAEGEEERILAGGRGCLSDFSPLVMFEIQTDADRNQRLKDRFAAAGYRLFRQLPGMPVLIPVDETEPLDESELNLFAAKPGRMDTLSRAGLLVEAAPEWRPDRDDHSEAAAFWKSQIFAPAVLAAGGRSESNDPGYRDGLTAYAIWRTADRPLAVRCAALSFAVKCLRLAHRQSPGAERASTFARAAWEWGARNDAALVLRQWVPRWIAAGPAPVEPFWPASPRFDHIAPQGQLGEWFAAAAAEQFERISSHSSAFAKPTDSLAWLCDRRFAPMEMERRRTLYAARQGRRPRVPERLRSPAPDHVNADLWRTGGVPGTVV
jgi:FkbM family methyltransferase